MRVDLGFLVCAILVTVTTGSARIPTPLEFINKPSSSVETKKEVDRITEITDQVDEVNLPTTTGLPHFVQRENVAEQNIKNFTTTTTKPTLTTTASWSTSTLESVNKDSVTLNSDGMKVSDLSEDLMEWEAPAYLIKNLPYYHAGHDDEGRPVWIGELGKYPLKQLADLQGEDFKVLDKYIQQSALRILKSIYAQNTTDREVTEEFLIVDLNGLDISIIVNPQSITLLQRLLKRYKDLLIHYLGACIVINTNYVGQLFINLARPFLGRAMERIEVYGTNAVKWKNALRRRLPAESYPPWYGGSADFKPVKVYG